MFRLGSEVSVVDVSGKCALVTGGAVRIGAAICERLAAAGVHVAVHCNQSRPEAEGLAKRLEADYGVRTALVQGGLDQPDQVERVMADARAGLGRIDILVNNAAVFHRESLMEMSVESLESELRVNALSPILLTQAFAAGYDGPEGEGVVVNLLDRRVATPAAGELPYQLSKRMLAAFTELAALELAPAVRVNGVAPGPVFPPPGEGGEYLYDRGGACVTPSRCTAGDVADAVLFLLGASSTTGQVLFVDSGQHLLGRKGI